jgi:ribonuclease BN (tRNA processing enzyme)
MARVLFLGSGDAFGDGGRFQACILVEGDGRRLLLDCGATSLVGMKARGVDPEGIDAILVSHLHGDHFGGIPFLILEAQFSRRTQPLLIAGPPGIEERVRLAMEVLFPGSTRTEQRFGIRFEEMASGTAVELAGAAVTPFEVVHASGATPFGYRIEVAGKVLGYSGDTEWTESLVAIANEADLFICECYSFEKQIRFHLSYRTIQEHRHELGCKRLVLTHPGPEMLARQDDVAEEIAEDGLTIVL